MALEFHGGEPRPQVWPEVQGPYKAIIRPLRGLIMLLRGLIMPLRAL